jgi:phosphatidylinositol alpha-mannosyltransferase
MKIALISLHSFYNPGGVKRHILGLHDEFGKLGVESKIIAPRRAAGERYGKDVILLGTSFMFPFGGSLSDLSVNFNPLAIGEVLKREKFDVLHFHNFGLPASLQFLVNPSAADALNILTFHSSMEGSQVYKNFPEFFYPIKKIVDWKIDGIIGVAPFILSKYFDDFPRKKAYIPNGIDLEQFNPSVRPVKSIAKKNTVKILFLGRLDKRKGLIYLLYAYRALAKQFSNIELIIVGNGPERARCKNYVKKHRLPRVNFLGAVDEKKAPSFYRSSDIYCSPATSGESFGIVLVEAMAVGLPVAAFANEGYVQVLGKGLGKKFLAKPKNWRELASKLALLIKNRELRKEAGRWGIEEAKNYGWPEIAARILEFYQACSQDRQKS